MKRPRKILVADLLCGAGGSSTGCEQALRGLGLQMELVCVNHWPVAIETHTKNHPQARHYCQDIATVRPHLIVPEGYLDLLMASPTCTHHSVARGGKEMARHFGVSARAVDLLPKLPAYPDKPSRAALGNEAAYKAAMLAWGEASRQIDDERRKLCERAAPLKTTAAIVLDPFGGAGTTGLVADRLQRNAILIELSPEYAAMARRRIDGDSPLFARAAE